MSGRLARTVDTPALPFAEWYRHVKMALEYLGFPPPLDPADHWRELWRGGIDEWTAIRIHPMPAVRAAAERLSAAISGRGG